MKRNVCLSRVGGRRRLIYTLSLVPLISSCAYLSKQSVAGACSNNLDSPILNFCVVTPHMLWRGAKPDKAGAAWLIQKGVRTIVNVELIHDDKSALGAASIADNSKHEVGYFRIRDWEPVHVVAPSVVDDHVAHFLAIVSQQPKPVYIHCRYGLDRTGVMIAAYRMLVEGLSTEQAIEEMERYHEPWFAVDAKYIRGLLPERREELRRKVMDWIPRLKRDARIVCENGSCVVSDR